ncbi:glycoside hydrolase family 13 protein [Listeria sp. SHR_NRA_18]|uniref:glycoside hydrolase family 13 protein n=1 Tax=Listeria sp. SHR_NRA_18 TaxID=2269046 RepID=UPI0009E03E1A|nr:glycoside hydrolase family 13 protein [Listeria sp. SHR_NRA_18]RQW66973.1 glycoside hydrolase family 13 protein [Listeria sp. SHR_NRA_18]
MVKVVLFDSWNELYKRPFGAVNVSATIDFRIDVALPYVSKVELKIHKDGMEEQSFEMNPTQGNAYQVSFQPYAATGLYFYYFKIQQDFDTQTRTTYYFNNHDLHGGEGFFTENYHDMCTYQLTCFQYADKAPEWYQNAVFYHIFVDRFFNADDHVHSPKPDSFIYARSEDTPYYIKNAQGEIVRWEFFGGNLDGITQKLTYLKELGITGLYLSPIFEAKSNHKYDTSDYKKIDPMFGDESILAELIQKAGEMGMRIVLDGVFNHVGEDSVYFNRYGNFDSVGAYQSVDSPYHSWFTFHQFPDQYDAWWGVSNLPVVNKQDADFQRLIYGGPDSVIDYWTSRGIAGWRLDVADELPDAFIGGIRQTLMKYPDRVLIGEVWEDATNKIAYDNRRHYLEGGMLQGVMNYPFRQIIIDLINGSLTAQQAAQKMMALKENYPNEALQANLNNIGTHDTARIFTMLSENKAKLRLAIYLLMVLPGVPCVYYGDEAGLTGGADPDNRKFYPWGREDADISDFFHTAIQLRNQNEALRKGRYYPFSLGLLFGVIRYIDDDNWHLFVMNPTGQEQQVDVTTIYPERDDWRPVLESANIHETSIAAYGFFFN